MKVLKVVLKDFNCSHSKDVYGVLVQYPVVKGEVWDYFDFVRDAHEKGVNIFMAAYVGFDEIKFSRKV